MVPARLAKNSGLFMALKRGLKSVFISHNGGSWQPEMSIPLDGERLIQLFELIAKGLAHWHWGIYLPSEMYLVKSAFVTSPGCELFEGLLARNAKNRVQESLGNGEFVYEGMQSAECPELTIWRMSLYGVVVGGDSRSPMGKYSDVYTLTAPKRMPAARELVRMLGGNS